MATYYFDTFDGLERCRDEKGEDLPHREAARVHAQELLPNIAEHHLPDGHRRDFIVDVRDSLGIIIYTCSLSLTGRWLDFSVPPNANRRTLLPD
ncbi:DUF6894 family protein [Roseomonas sp. WA12]